MVEFKHMEIRGLILKHSIKEAKFKMCEDSHEPLLIKIFSAYPHTPQSACILPSLGTEQ